MKEINKYEQILNRLNEAEKSGSLSDEEFFIRSRVEKLLRALRLGFTHAIYSGGVVETTKEFCRSRNGRVFSIDEVERWVDAQDRPIASSYDPFIHLGGDCCEEGMSFCRHSLLYIPKEEADRRIQLGH